MASTAWFESWDSLYKIFISTLVGYAVLILFVRIFGKRSTSKMNNFDWIVTVAVGSVLASMAVLKDVTVSDGILAIILLLGGQFLITTATSRWEWARVLLLSPSSTLYENGRFREAELRKQRVSQREILSAVRENGLDCLEDVDIITFEPDAEIAVVRKQQTNDSTNADAGEPT
ncbi:DUF421 domain-containing protein [Rubinisphaera sp. JC750]|uniref:DUF421 domain-containing protein n=1 Tax=Rubinisphaera sp. JC750 TaxID=2898658 RepID=UPI001F1A1BBB|nr:YetF domain-containing protein [Rubinisphaera sp. JC750]